MKYNKPVTALLAVLLALCLSLGAVGCMATAFSLTLDMGRLVRLCALTALFCALCFSWKWGGLPVLLAAALAAGYLWRQDTLPHQLAQLLYRISHYYDQAYHWGVLKLVDTPWDAGTAQQPMALLGMVLAVITTRSVCRGKGAALPVSLSLLPLLSCVVVTDTVPAASWLYLLLLGQLLLILTAGVREGDGYQGNRLTLLALLPTALLLGLLLLAMPRENYVNPTAALRERILAWVQELPGHGSATIQTTGPGLPAREPRQVELASLGDREESTDPVLYAAAEVGGTLYLRGQDYDLYDGARWQTSPTRVEELRYDGIDLGYVAVETRREQAQLYLPYYPRYGLSLIGGSYGNTRLARSYSFVRVGLPDDWREQAAQAEAEIAALPYAAGQPDSAYLALPEAARSRAENLLEPVLTGYTTTSDKAHAIAAYVRGSAVYDKRPSRMPPEADDFALWFLEEGERGYCVHFATATAVLLRAAGIPARYVSGYMFSARAGETMAVTGEHAHAWVEYYEPGLKTWLVLESTPAAGTPAPEPRPTEPAPVTVPVTSEPSAATEAPPPESVAEITAPATEIPPETTGNTPSEAPAPPETPPASLSNSLRILLTALLLGITLEGQRQLRLRLRRLWLRRGSPNRRALKRWRRTERLSALLGEKPPKPLYALAQKAKFSQHTLTPEELAQFDAFLQEAETQLRSRPWYRQLIYRYIFAI